MDPWRRFSDFGVLVYFQGLRFGRSGPQRDLIHGCPDPFEDVRQARKFGPIHRICLRLREAGFGQEEISKIELASEEALVNIFRYAYPERPGDVEVNCKLDEGRFILEIIDSGIPFDLTAIPDRT